MHIDCIVIWRCRAMRHTAAVPFNTSAMSQLDRNTWIYSPLYSACKFRQHKVPPLGIRFFSLFHCPDWDTLWTILIKMRFCHKCMLWLNHLTAQSLVPPKFRCNVNGMKVHYLCDIFESFFEVMFCNGPCCHVHRSMPRIDVLLVVLCCCIREMNLATSPHHCTKMLHSTTYHISVGLVFLLFPCLCQTTSAIDKFSHSFIVAIQVPDRDWEMFARSSFIFQLIGYIDVVVFFEM